MKLTPWFLVLGVVMAAGCYRSPDIHIHEPHQYEGKADPLLTLEQSASQQQTLLKRFETVQTDR